MAVLDPKKLLPSSKEENKRASYSNATRFLVPAKNVQYRDTAPVSPEPDQQESNIDLKKDVLIIKEKVISIEDILKKSLDLQKKTLIGKSRDLENKKRAKKENILEQKKDKPVLGGLSVPTKRIGLFDSIKNFVTSTLLGFVLVRLVKYLPQIIDFAKKITPAITFIESFIGGMANKLISFIEIGYGVYDKVRDTIKNIGGENLQKTFDQFSGQLNTFINLAIIAGMSTMGGTDFGMGKKGPKGLPTKPGTKPTAPSNQSLNRYLNRGKEAKLIERKFGNSAARYYEELRDSGKNSTQAFKEVKKRFQPRGLFNRRNISGLAGEGQTAGQVGRRGFGRTATRFAAKNFGKGGAKIASGATKALGRFPIIGPLVDFAFRYFVLREPLGKSAAGAVGAGVGQALGTWLGGTVGGVAGTVVPIIGNLIGAGAGAAIGGLLGGLIGDQLGVSLYETIVAYQKPPKIEGRAKGGQVSTRGGKQVGGKIQRSFKRAKPKPPKINERPVQIGRDVGGQEVIEKVFTPEDPKNSQQMSSLRVLTTASSELKKPNSSFFGQIMGVGVDLVMGQKPNKNFYNQVGNAFGSVIQQLIDTNADMAVNDTARTILAMANGGIVPTMLSNDKLNFGERVGNAVAGMFRQFVERQSDIILNSIKLESEKTPPAGSVTGDPTAGLDGELAAGTVARGQITIEQLVGLAKGAGFSQSDAIIMAAIAMAESGGNSNAHNAKPPDNSYGLWQINMIGNLGPERRKQIGITSDDQLKDPVINAHAAKLIKQSQGFSAWTVYKTGAYKKYLNSAQKSASASPITVYKPSTGTNIDPNMKLGRGQGNLQSVRSLAESMGVPLFSSYRPGSRGYHGVGRAMDFSNDSKGLGTPQQLALAKEIVKRYGSSVQELIYTPLGFGISGGKKVPLTHWGPPSKSKWAGGDPSNTNAAHYDHVHVAFKKGGYTGDGGVGLLHKNEMVMSSKAVNLFGRETFEAMNEMGNKMHDMKPSAKISKVNKKSYVPESIKSQASYESTGMTVVILPVHERIKSTSTVGSGGRIPNIGRSAHIDNSIESALA
jgi:hypothetical protein